MAKILAFANQKGGVGKTTSAINIAACLGAKGKRVLLVDSDPQGNAGSGVGINRQKLKVDLMNVLMEGADIRDAVVKTAYKGLDAVGATMGLAGAELELAEKDKRESTLKKALAVIENDYDYVIIDCPPSLGLLTINALCAADEVIVPMQCEYFALEGLSALSFTIRQVKKLYNPRLVISGIVLTMYDGRLNLTLAVKNEINKFFPGIAFKNAVPRNVRLSEAPSHGKPIIYYDKYSRGGIAYTAIVDELLQRHGE
ncbi:MAG: ParA family protein [Ruminococcaceae bacterium]|nr:ParA family protein [Oscillospiraceae bacterium]